MGDYSAIAPCDDHRHRAIETCPYCRISGLEDTLAAAREEIEALRNPKPIVTVTVDGPHGKQECWANKTNRPQWGPGEIWLHVAQLQSGIREYKNKHESARAEIARLRREVENLHQRYNVKAVEGMIPSLIARAEKAEAQLQSVREVVNGTKHEPGCSAVWEEDRQTYYDIEECDCFIRPIRTALADEEG